MRDIKLFWRRVQFPLFLLLVLVYLFAAWAGLYKVTKVVWAFVR